MLNEPLPLFKEREKEGEVKKLNSETTVQECDASEV